MGRRRSAGGAEREMARGGWFAGQRYLALGCASVALFVAAWEAALTWVVRYDPFFITKPSLIAAAFDDLILRGRLWRDCRRGAVAFAEEGAPSVSQVISLLVVMGWRRRLD